MRLANGVLYVLTKVNKIQIKKKLNLFNIMIDEKKAAIPQPKCAINALINNKLLSL